MNKYKLQTEPPKKKGEDKWMATLTKSTGESIIGYGKSEWQAVQDVCQRAFK